MPTKQQNLFKVILWAGLLVGTLDILAAVIQTLTYGGNPMNMLRFIASGVFGITAFKGGTSTALWGLFFHYVIAISWTAFFFLIYPTIKKIMPNTMVIATFYGFFLWLVMNFIVLPLSQTPPIPFKLSRALIAIGILIIAIGFPLVLIAQKYLSIKKQTKASD